MSTHRSVFASKASYTLLATSSLAVITWRILQWRARKRAKIVADRAQRMVEDGPMIDTADPYVRMRLLNTAIRRAQKWMSFLTPEDAKPMRGQVGGLSFQKKPILTLAPDYILKPLHRDARGFREIAFYEAIKLASHKGGNTSITAGNGMANDADKQVNGSNNPGSVALHNCDAVAMWLAIFVQDQIVAQSEHTLLSSWRSMNREIELLRRLSTFTPHYYGVLGQDLVKFSYDGPIEHHGPSEILSDSYLLLSDATINFQKPCAIDLKMGWQTFEPDASFSKREKEFNKYLKQREFGFRIIGMRIYDPCHPEADQTGFRVFDKMFGRSLDTREQVVNALYKFFKCVALPSESCEQTDIDENVNKPWSPTASCQKGLRIRAISNLMSQLRLLRKLFEDNKSLAFYSSSILMVYEGDVTGASSNVTNLKMIDFAHVRRQAGGDEGYLHGIESLIQIFNELLQDG